MYQLHTNASIWRLANDINKMLHKCKIEPLLAQTYTAFQKVFYFLFTFLLFKYFLFKYVHIWIFESKVMV